MTAPAHTSANKPAPARLPGAGGSRRRVSRAEQLERRKLVLGLMSNHIPDEDIVAQCDKKFGMTRAAAKRLIRECEHALHEQSKALLPVLKSKAVNRLHAHIVKAAKDGSWNAVAALEGRLARIQGTEAPVELNVNVEAEVRESVVALLSTLPPATVATLAQQGAQLLQGDNGAALLGPPAPASLQGGIAAPQAAQDAPAPPGGPLALPSPAKPPAGG